jgi:hypothetical protein
MYVPPPLPLSRADHTNSFYYDGHTRSPSRWLLPSPSSNDTLCLYSLHVPAAPLSNSSAPPPATSLVLNVVKTSNGQERNHVETLRRRLFPGCLISIPVNYWTRTTTAAVEDEDPWVPYRPGGGVLDDYLGRERALKSIVFGSLHIRYAPSPHAFHHTMLMPPADRHSSPRLISRGCCVPTTPWRDPSAA